MKWNLMSLLYVRGDTDAWLYEAIKIISLIKTALEQLTEFLLQSPQRKMLDW